MTLDHGPQRSVCGDLAAGDPHGLLAQRRECSHVVTSADDGAAAGTDPLRLVGDEPPELVVVRLVNTRFR